MSTRAAQFQATVRRREPLSDHLVRLVLDGLDAVAGELGLGGFDKMLDERLEEMDSIGVDMQLVTPTVGFYQYGNDLEVTRRIARECNDEIAEMVGAHPTRLSVAHQSGRIGKSDLPSGWLRVARTWCSSTSPRSNPTLDAAM